MYALAAILPLLPAKQRDTDPDDWMSTDAEVACPDPHCGGRFRITREGRRWFRHAETTGLPEARGTPYWQDEDPMSVETTELRPGHRISRVIKGGWQLAGDHGEVRSRRGHRRHGGLLDAGITTFDCADIYKGVEEMIGTFIADVRRRRGAEVADRVTVHTKLVPDLGLLADIRPDEVEAIVDRSLKRLQIERMHAGAVLLVGHEPRRSVRRWRC
jgi:hypothetical protein